MCLKFYWCVMHWLWVSFRFVPGCSYFGKGARNVNIVARVPGSLKKFARFNISTELWASPVQCNCAVQYCKQSFFNAISFWDNWKRAFEVRNYQRTWLLRVNSCLLSIYLPFRVAKTGFIAGQTSLEFYEGKTNKNSISRVLMYVAMRERWRWCWPRRQVEGNGKAFLGKLFESYILSAFSKKMCISWHSWQKNHIDLFKSLACQLVIKLNYGLAMLGSITIFFG